jgi:hypothetical protein
MIQCPDPKRHLIWPTAFSGRPNVNQGSSWNGTTQLSRPVHHGAFLLSSGNPAFGLLLPVIQFRAGICPDTVEIQKSLIFLAVLLAVSSHWSVNNYYL